MKQRYADITYQPDLSDEAPWNVSLYEGTLKSWDCDDFMWSQGACDHAEAIQIASDWIHHRGHFAQRTGCGTTVEAATSGAGERW